LIERLAAAGCPNVEAAAFVSPKWVPQMADSAEVMALVQRRPGTVYSALVPNLQGFDKALESRIDEVVVFGAASEPLAQEHQLLDRRVDRALSPGGVCAKSAPAPSRQRLVRARLALTRATFRRRT